MAWTTIRLEVTTPLFNGGAGGDAGFRVPSLRGALRFWFRTLAGVGVGANIDALAELERRVFGGTDAQSPVKMRIAQQPQIVEAGPGGVKANWCNDPQGGGQWISYLLGQGLGSSEKNAKSKSQRDYLVIRSFISPGEPVAVDIRFGDPEVAAVVLGSLWLMCTFGGLGARVRRGFGGLRIVDVDGELPAPWTREHLLTPNLDDLAGIKRLDPAVMPVDCLSILATIARRREPVSFCVNGSSPNTKALYPTLGVGNTNVGLSGRLFESWAEVLAYAGEQFRWFRAGKDTPGVRYQPEIKTSEWEAVVTSPRESTNRFGLGALGLPINFKKDCIVNARGPGGEELRRASPLWLRPVGTGGEWKLLSVAFTGQFLPKDVEVRLQGRIDKRLCVKNDDLTERTNRWIKQLRAGATFVRSST